MPHDPFGNLREWGCVLDLLEDLKSTGRLAECQRGLCRILRFRGNWRLRDEVLRRLDRIERPDETLIEEVANIVADHELSHETRILACEVLPRMIEKTGGASAARLCPRTRSVLEKLESLVAAPQPPILRRALDGCLRAIV